jgi:hypothetical protein
MGNHDKLTCVDCLLGERCIELEKEHYKVSKTETPKERDIMTVNETLEEALKIVMDKARSAHQTNDAWIVTTLPYITQKLDYAINYAKGYADWETTIEYQLSAELFLARGIIKASQEEAQ